MTVLLVLQLVSSAPALSPAAAADVLRRCACLANRTDAPASLPPLGPAVVVVRSSATDGPFGPLVVTPIAPLSNQPAIYWPPFLGWPVVRRSPR